jgi:benzoyl-CoA reductase/2-hydroxyglutaryl-CoA dehydratase subunit BcrC/BadD/HgdB
VNRNLIIQEDPQRLSLEEWDRNYEKYAQDPAFTQPSYGGPLSRHFARGDYRLKNLHMDNSPAALRLWNLLLTEEARLRKDRYQGKLIVGTMKDLGTIPVLCDAFPGMTAFYPDGAWWIPCIMELSDQLFRKADALGIDDSYCPVRALLGAFDNESHFPVPDTLICSAGAVCDDFSAIAQILEGTGQSIHWWEVPARPEDYSPGNTTQKSAALRAGIREELHHICRHLEDISHSTLTPEALWNSIDRANYARQLLQNLRHMVFTAPLPPFPALEMLIAEMLIIHYCSDYSETCAVYEEMLATATRRLAAGKGHGEENDVKIFWINPVADLRIMNILEDAGGRLCGSEFLFSHARAPLDTEYKSPFDSLAEAILNDPLIGTTQDRGRKIITDIKKFQSRGVIISRIPGASHCAFEGHIIGTMIQDTLNIPVLEIEVPPLSDSLCPSLTTRISALIETARPSVL